MLLVGVSKCCTIPYSDNYNVHFRWQAFDITNSEGCDVRSNAPWLVQVAELRQYTRLLTNPGVRQLALRYKF